jgi:hypothetical protein
MSKRTWEPKSYPIRDPRTTEMAVGRIINPPRGIKFGGPGEMAFFDTQKKLSGQNQRHDERPVQDRGKGERNPI